MGSSNHDEELLDSQVSTETLSSLRELSIQCRDLLQQLSADDGAADGPEARETLASLNVWMANMGVFRKGQQSLASRLTNVPDMSNLVQKLLVVLKHKLERRLLPEDDQEERSSASESDLSSDSSSDRSSQSYRLPLDLEESDHAGAQFTHQPESTIWTSIQITITSLRQLEWSMRLAGAAYRQERIRLFKGRHSEWYEMLERSARVKINSHKPSLANASEILRQRAAESIAKRLTRFRYLKVHQEKKVSTLQKPASVLQQHQNEFVPESPPDQQQEDRISLHHNLESPTVMKCLPIQLDLARLQPPRNKTSRPESVISVKISNSVDFPPIPKLNPEGSSFTCPYCLLVCPAEEVSGKKQWQTHVIHDLEPFFCVFDECTSAFTCADSYTGWLDHMRVIHTQPEWCCLYCQTDSSTSVSFAKPEYLESHLEENHQKQFRGSLHPTRIKNSMIRPKHALRECPFCGGLPDVVEKDPSKWDNESVLERLEKHVRDHLVSIALILAPTEEEEEPAGQHNKAQLDAQRDEQSERDLDGVGDPYELECNNASCDCRKLSDLDFAQSISPGHNVGEDEQALWDIVSPWKKIQTDKERNHENDPLPLGLLHQVSLPDASLPSTSLSVGSLPRASLPRTSFQSRGIDLVDHINDSLRDSVFPTPNNGYFAPKNTLTAITESSVTHTLWRGSKSFESLESSDKKLVEFISREAPEIFAIGIYMDTDLRNMMSLFMKHDQTDRNLPFSNVGIEKIWPEPRHKGRRRSFQDSQHLFKAQEFPMQDRFPVIKLKPRVVLPILESEHTSQGQFGIVYKVKIHQDFLELKNPLRKAQGVAAIKELRESIETRNAERAWEREVKALREICKLDLPHVVDIAAMISIGKKQYFVFPWADGGNLLDLWKSRDSYHHRSDIARKHVPDILDQLIGLTDSLARLHAFQYGNAASYRHGDLKPENILIFDNNNHSFPGVWKLADLGLARYHMAATGDRIYVTSNSGAGTISYQPPESVNARAAPTSRLYDIWSMGCIILQLMTWLLYGTRRIDELTRNTRSAFAEDESSYWTASWNVSRGYHNIDIHPSVKKHIAQMKRDLQGSEALLDLLSIVEYRLLIVKLPPSAKSSQPGRRANTSELHLSLQKIQAACKDQRYWFSGKNIVGQPSISQLPQGQSSGTEKGTYLKDNWVITSDKTFFEKLLCHPELRNFIAPDTVPVAKLCVKCQNLDFFTRQFQIEDTLEDLRREASFCDFCRIRWHLGKDCFSNDVPSILFELIDSNLQLNHRPVISFLTCHADTGLELGSGDPTETWPQNGLPRLPPVGSEAHFTILRNWLQECDEHHEECRPSKNHSTRLPTRLIDVGETGAAGVRLYETKRNDMFEYLALSHPWGPDRSSHFCTYPENLDHHLQGILLEDLPQTFRDAVKATRRLNKRYLWIDSVCIVQGPNGDFNEQVKHMEGIFRQAYCVLNASSSLGQQDGFMKPRHERISIQIQQNFHPPFYACEFIDNFQQQALDSYLNRQAWVLQERALARRTIFFTDKQTYWECGAGVRCETTMRMNNELASLLGDARFPEIAQRSTDKLRLCQYLYSKYSRLVLVHAADRPVAIAILETRLISSFDVRGGFGVLDDGHRAMLMRSLVWQRAQDAMQKINFGSGWSNPPPSWSWMSYQGAIDYLNLPFNQVEWEEADFLSHWRYDEDQEPTNDLILTVTAREFDLREAKISDRASVILDDPNRVDELEPSIKCVILGRLKDPGQYLRHRRTHYVLLVVPVEANSGDGSQIYNRVGVGSMPGDLVDFSELGKLGELR